LKELEIEGKTLDLKREEEARKREEEARKREEEARKNKELDLKREEEARKREQEARKMTAFTRFYSLSDVPEEISTWVQKQISNDNLAILSLFSAQIDDNNLKSKLQAAWTSASNY
jgi:negative regulator of genetic competence, sporulation and motility